MPGRGLQPIELSAEFWVREDVVASLRCRELDGLFRLLTKYGRLSQTQIAIAVGMTQGQVSTIMSGSRKVIAFDVIERVFDGLAAPDAARMAFGLAPRRTVAGAAHKTEVPDPADTGSGGQFQRGWGEDMRRRELLQWGSFVTLATVAPEQGAESGRVRVARALTSYSLWGVDGGDRRPAMTLAQLSTAVARAKRDYQACRYSVVLEGLPDLLTQGRLLCDTATGDEQLRAYALMADAYQVTGSVMIKLDDRGLAAFAAERSIQAATLSEDPVAIAASARSVTHSLMSGGHAQRAAEIAARAAERLTAELPRPDAAALSVFGALLLRGAVAAALAENRGEATRLLDEADDAARRLGRDDNARWTAFGPTNVGQHRVHIAMVLGDAGTAVDLARRVDVSKIALAERKAGLFIDTAQALSQWGKHEQAYHALLMADDVAPEEVRNRGAVRNLIGDLAVRAPRTVQAKVRAFADEVGVPL